MTKLDKETIIAARSHCFWTKHNTISIDEMKKYLIESGKHTIDINHKEIFASIIRQWYMIEKASEEEDFELVLAFLKNVSFNEEHLSLFLSKLIINM